MRKNLSEGSCFFNKNFQFLSKKQLPSKEHLPARLLSVAKNSALCALSSSIELRFKIYQNVDYQYFIDS